MKTNRLSSIGAVLIMALVVSYNHAHAISWVGNFSGNDDIATVENLLGLTGVTELSQLKVTPPGSAEAYFGVFSTTGTGKSGTWSYEGGFDSSLNVEVHALVLKAGPNFALYEFDYGYLAPGEIVGGEWNVAGIEGTGADPLLVGRGRNVPNLGHASLYVYSGAATVGSVPDGGSMVFLVGMALGALGVVRGRFR